jgi:diguanylate cyclase (GGDEF)-like protein
MNLKPRFMLLTIALFVISAAIVWGLVRQLSESIVEEWAVRYAEKQVLYDKARALQPILREIALSHQFARSRLLKEWASNPNDPELKARAIAEMEAYRQNFGDHSYFVALLDSGEYYHNNAANAYAGRQYRYTLDPERDADRWFFDIIEQNRDMHLNVNPDVELGVTKLWIDVLMRDGDRILGVVGTGLDLTEFLNRVVDQHEPGITSLFTDHEGAIQLYRDQSLIDFASITKAAADKNTLSNLLPDPQDRAAIKQIMSRLQQEPDRVLTRFVTLEDGRRHLAGIAYLPEIDWYEVTLLDLSVVLPLSSFSGILVTFAIMLLLALLILHQALNHFLISPLGRLEHAMDDIRRGHYPSRLETRRPASEIGRLMQYFRAMASAVQDSRETLEQQVQNRTEALERLSKTDALTELLNRRGMQERLEAQLQHLARDGRRFGLIWLDLDQFKEINDRYGHEAGDRVLIAVAQQLRVLLRRYDCAARWGGDEFLVMVETDDAELLAQLGERIREAVAALRIDVPQQDMPLQPTLSAGSYLASRGDSLETVLHNADGALYRAKAGGRNTHCQADKETAAR